MRHFIVTTAALALMVITCTSAWAADQCPSELAKAKTTLKGAQASLNRGSRAQAGAKSQEIEASRTQDIQAPRAPQDVPVPRGQEIQAPRVAQATTLLQESEAACKKGDLALSSRKAKEALDFLKK